MIKEGSYFNYFFLLVILFLSTNAFAQSNDSITNWDNQMYLGNKVSIASGNWRYTGEAQVRLKDNIKSLDNWYIEGVASYLMSEHFELVPDLRVTVKPHRTEYRPGFGIFYKFNAKKFQFVNQLKWQLDFGSDGTIENGLRYAIFTNRKLNDKLLSSFAGGIFYRWKEGFNGIQFIRFGPGLGFIIDDKHIFNFSYLLSMKNNGQSWEWAGIPVIQLSININKDYKYIPAKYISF